MRAEKISRIRERFKDEWLLIRVIEFDRKRTVPLTGTLIAHSKDKQALNPVQNRYKKALTYLTHTGERLPKGYAILF